jgi:hypothetical protein
LPEPYGGGKALGPAHGFEDAATARLAVIAPGSAGAENRWKNWRSCNIRPRAVPGAGEFARRAGSPRPGVQRNRPAGSSAPFTQ